VKLWLLSFFLTHWAFAASLKPACSARELARQDCRLEVGKFNLRLLTKSIAWSNGTWHLVDELPLKGEASAWEKASFALMGRWPILQLWLWDKGEGEVQVQSLHWYVFSARERKLTLLNQGVVRRRRPEADRHKFIYDSWETHSLTLLKNGQLQWQLSDQKKTFANTSEENHGI
jgi:hypothetical protein